MDLDFAVLADGVTARPDGKLDIFGAGFDTIFAVGTPATHPRLVVALRVLLSRHELAHDHQLEVILQASDGDELARAVGELDAVPEASRAELAPGRQAGLGMLLNFENVTFPAFGAYQLVIHWDGNELRSPLQLFLAEASGA